MYNYVQLKKIDCVKMKNVKAVIFDIDGTLLDTTEFIFKSYEHTFKTHGIPLKSRRKLSVIFGKPLEECYRLLVPSLDIDKLCKTHMFFQLNNLHLVRPFVNTKKTLKLLKGSGIKIAAVTTRSKLTSIKSLIISRIEKYIDIVISREDVKNPKPHPESIFSVLEKLGVKAKESVMVGDTDVDIKTGKNAGVRTIGVTYGFNGLNKDKVIKIKPDVLVDDISDIVSLILG